MQPASEQEYRASLDDTLPLPEAVAPGVFVVSQPIPSSHVPYTLSYFIVDTAGAVHLIDPGWDSDENFSRLQAALTAFGSTIDAIESILVTHLHIDHLGMAARLQAATGAPIVMHESERDSLRAVLAQQNNSGSDAADDPDRALLLDSWGVPADRRLELLAAPRLGSAIASTTADRGVVHAETLDIPGHELQVIHTPGHTPGHLCLVNTRRKLIFTGDHILPTLYPGLGLGARVASPHSNPVPANPIADYLSSLDRVEPFDDYLALPGHGYRFTGLGERRVDTELHHLTRSRQVAAIVSEKGQVSVWQIAERVSWSAGWDNLPPFNRISALAQTEMHRDFVTSAEGRSRLQC
ncbi:MBL fold metallo-hydrolase [Subtercola frigoramans]|uniref:Glyoxylase-like metal-dependent hydrolase (Beta-lactamase superfamily II) n=1 Tax=Subtercola frigoramans TaxID=120298 RepID=A0ABS2L5T3_9MICO|nr:MBL fold metallo-hydrolase [Subtercola frigoramans]MBM7472427.1 glyoxylase-like metal-dependent hydrolase (beta-lactamase superfamily II) [Subtercola frigoramans]